MSVCKYQESAIYDEYFTRRDSLSWQFTRSRRPRTLWQKLVRFFVEVF